MVQFISGTIGYIKMTYREKKFIFFLDNHDTSSYCKNAVYVHQIFDTMFPDSNLYVEEPIIKNNNLKLVFSSPHIEKYLEYLKTKKAFYFDVRFELEKENLISTFYEVLLFLDSMTIKNLERNLSNRHHRKMIVLFIYHFLKYYSKNKIPRKGHSPLIYTTVPFINSESFVKKLSNNELKEILLSSTMEYYLILLLLNSKKENNIIYLGAAHGITVSRLLAKYHNFVIKEDMNIEIGDIFDLSKLDSLPSCLNTALHHFTTFDSLQS